MSGTAPYEVNLIGSDDEDYVFTLSFEMMDGTGFAFDEYEIEYSLRKDGCNHLVLTQTNGIAIEGQNVTFDAGRSMRRGEYEHGCRLKHPASGKYLQVFNGSVRLGEGGF